MNRDTQRGKLLLFSFFLLTLLSSSAYATHYCAGTCDSHWYFHYHDHINQDGSADTVISSNFSGNELNNLAINSEGHFPFDGNAPSGAIGVVSGSHAVDGTEHDWNGDKFSLMYAKDMHDSDGNVYVNANREETTMTADMFRFMYTSTDASTGLCFSNDTNLKELKDVNCTNPIFQSGMPTYLNFFFSVNLDVTIENSSTGATTDVTCQNLILAQQGDEKFGPSLTHAFSSAISAGIKLGNGIGDLIATDGDEGWRAAGQGVIKTANAAKQVDWAIAAEHNPWFFGQLFSDSSTNYSMYLPNSSGPDTSLDKAQTRAIMVCSENRLLIVTHDTNSYDTFEVEFVPYSIPTLNNVQGSD